jgi:hypothetical protein
MNRKISMDVDDDVTRNKRAKAFVFFFFLLLSTLFYPIGNDFLFVSLFLFLDWCHPSHWSRGPSAQHRWKISSDKEEEEEEGKRRKFFFCPRNFFLNVLLWR